jgi:hypothetical protein
MEDFVNFEIAKKLKEKGFTCQYPIAMYNELGEFYALYTSADCNPNINCMFGNREYYDYDDFDEHDCVCPTISQVLKWFRDEKNTYCLPWFEQGVDMWFYAICKPISGCDFPEFMSESDYNTYEQAAIAGIEYVLDNLI